MKITREQFCLLTNMQLETLKSRTRRFQMPFDSDDDVRKRHGYSFFDALLTICVLNLGDHPLMLDPARAAFIVKSVERGLAGAWSDIIKSSAKPRSGIIWSRCWSFNNEDGLVVVGTAQEVAKRIANHKFPILQQVSQSASQAAALLIANAERHGIEIPKEVLTAKLGAVA